jgi:uncharacterized membrane protein YkvA (DUF1232 family)
MSPQKKKNPIVDVETIKEEIVEDAVQEVIDEDIRKIKEEIIADPGIKRLLFYEKLRKKFAGKMTEDRKLNKLSDYLFLLPDFFILLCRLLMEERVTNQTKAFIIGVIAYIMLPIDIIPDFIPVIGFVDDLILVVFALDQILKQTDEKIIIANWSGRRDFLQTIENIMDIANRAVSHRILMKIKGILRKFRIA